MLEVSDRTHGKRESVKFQIRSFIDDFLDWLNSVGEQRPTATKRLLFILATAVTLILILFSLQLEDSKGSSTLVSVFTVIYGLIATAVSAHFSSYDLDKKVKAKVDEKISSTWLPNAESACMSLLSLANSVQVLKLNQAGSCNRLDIHFDEKVEASQRKRIKAVVDRQCTELASDLSEIENQIINSLMVWARFIETNCVDDACSPVFDKLAHRKRNLRDQLLYTFPERETEINLSSSSLDGVFSDYTYFDDESDLLGSSIAESTILARSELDAA